MDYELLKYTVDGVFYYEIWVTEQSGERRLEVSFQGTDDAEQLTKVKEYTNEVLNKTELVAPSKIDKFITDVNAL